MTAVRKSAVCSSRLKKIIFWYNYTLYTSPQSASPRAIYSSKLKKRYWYDLTICTSPHVSFYYRTELPQVRTFLYFKYTMYDTIISIILLYKTELPQIRILSPNIYNNMYYFTIEDWITASPHAVKSVFFLCGLTLIH